MLDYTTSTFQGEFNSCAFQRLVTYWSLRVNSHLHNYVHRPLLHLVSVGLRWKGVVLGEPLHAPLAEQHGCYFPWEFCRGHWRCPEGWLSPLLDSAHPRVFDVAVGLFPLLILILSDALAMLLPSQVSSQIFWMVCTNLYKIGGYIFCGEILCCLPFSPLG